MQLLVAWASAFPAASRSLASVSASLLPVLIKRPSGRSDPLPVVTRFENEALMSIVVYPCPRGQSSARLCLPPNRGRP